jgi:uncharacterized membrane protein
VVAPPPDDDGTDLLSSPAGIAAILGLVILVIVAVAFVLASRRREAEPEAMAPPREVPPTEGPLTIEVTDAHDMGLQSFIPSHVETFDEEGPPQVVESEVEEGRTEAPPEPVLESLDLPEATMELSEAERAEQDHDLEVREIMKVLTQLPRGLPTSLWGKDMSRLAKEIVDGPKRTADDGTHMVQIDGRWYSSDHRKMGKFLQEWKEEKGPRASDTTSGSRAKRLKQLEERLIEGKISEETYERLRKKYEEG